MSRNSAELPICPVGIAAEELRAIQRFLLALLHQRGQLGLGEVRGPASFEPGRPLERRPVFVLVGVVALQVGIAPGRARRRARARRLGGQVGGERDGAGRDEDQRTHRGALCHGWQVLPFTGDALESLGPGDLGFRRFGMPILRCSGCVAQIAHRSPVDLRTHHLTAERSRIIAAARRRQAGNGWPEDRSLSNPQPAWRRRDGRRVCGRRRRGSAVLSRSSSCPKSWPRIIRPSSGSAARHARPRR